MVNNSTLTLMGTLKIHSNPSTSFAKSLNFAMMHSTQILVKYLRPSLVEYDAIRDAWRSQDKVMKLLGIFSSNRLFTDWKVAQPDENTRKGANWRLCNLTENPTLMNPYFRAVTQANEETFPALCNHVQKEAKHCNFKYESVTCMAEDVAVRDKIVIGMRDNQIREEALQKSWDLPTLRKEGLKMESAAQSGGEISGEAVIKWESIHTKI